jgi:hypothetical protein
MDGLAPSRNLQTAKRRTVSTLSQSNQPVCCSFFGQFGRPFSVACRSTEFISQNNVLDLFRLLAMLAP